MPHKRLQALANVRDMQQVNMARMSSLDRDTIHCHCVAKLYITTVIWLVKSR